MLRERTVYLATSEGLLFQLGDQKGYGKLTKQNCGNDRLAERLISSIAQRVVPVPVTAALLRDESGYLPLLIDYLNINPSILNLPRPLCDTICRLYRKRILCPFLGDVLPARIVRITDKGTVLSVYQTYNSTQALRGGGGGGAMTLTSVAAFERPSRASLEQARKIGAEREEDGSVVRDDVVDELLDVNKYISDEIKQDDKHNDSNCQGAENLHQHSKMNDEIVSMDAIGCTVDVRILDYHAETGVLNVTLQSDVIKMGVTSVTAYDEEVLDQKWTRGFHQLRVGDKVTGKVLLSSTDDSCAVVEVKILAPRSCEGNKETEELEETVDDLPPLHGFESISVLAYLKDLEDKNDKKMKYAIQDTVTILLEYVPSSLTMMKMTPFLVATPFNAHRQTAIRPSKARLEVLRAMRHNNNNCSKGGLSGIFPWRVIEHSHKHPREDDDHEEGVRRRKVEEAIDAFERQTDVIPASPEEFNKLLLASPNSSFLWTQYIAYFLGLQQIERARLTAEQAFKTIHMNERKELLNIWVAYLNLENLHGTAESLSAVFRRALQHSDDPLVVHEKLADIFKSSKKQEQEFAICRAMISKFRDVPRVWERLGVMLLGQDKRDQLKKIIKDMGNQTNCSLSPVDQVLVLEHLAISEYKAGRIDSGRSLFESLVLKVPKKSDVWQAYIDQELSQINRNKAHIGEKEVQPIRNIFERMSTVKFSPKVMRQLLTSWLTFEQEHGSAANVEKVKGRARDYVASKLTNSAQ